MSNNLLSLLSQWQELKDEANWVLGTVYKTEGPAYRKKSAMMLFSDAGHQLGMLSGGCLESDIHLHARKAIASQKPIMLTYDGSDEDDITFQLGIGCGGTVYILLQPLTIENDYLELNQVLQALEQHQTGYFYQKISNKEISARFIFDQIPPEQQDDLTLCTRIKAPLHLLIAGGGIDARPVAQIAHHLGWQVSLWDPRPANGRMEYFPNLIRRLSGKAYELRTYCQNNCVQAAVLMSHNVNLDAQVLSQMAGLPLKYIALLGPVNRREQVIAQSSIELNQLSVPLSGPAGLDIGADLPETIALAILAECQAAITNTPAHSLSGALKPSNKRQY
ncbi:XdhC family protein [Vibrio sagamiensis]|uniref:Xanthine and CO dehydrogenase family maturation factor XdhC/CoxF family protein n=1 Tax=Vibrio sagamiensis NBRC 104589 TaxID=1219064 RepID=A0A511QCE6_9VIBR|nr:XdhC/CoxI family protein [Vibrio sagamiensis]PNQ56120.1 isoquinoline 1-oxidoreductase [Vibrio agarivorans]GEM74970.1 xanthine and CO dehydrogenase family maturation factor XdhC/CoxF family protein [Vibrio sagamiensis NBRC 104589]